MAVVSQLTAQLEGEQRARQEADQRADQLEGEAKGLTMTLASLEEDVERKEAMIRTLTEEMAKLRGSLAAAVASQGSGSEDGEDASASLMAENWTLKAELSRAQEDLAAGQAGYKVRVHCWGSAKSACF